MATHDHTIVRPCGGGAQSHRFSWCVPSVRVAPPGGAGVLRIFLLGVIERDGVTVLGCLTDSDRNADGLVEKQVLGCSLSPLMLDGVVGWMA